MKTIKELRELAEQRTIFDIMKTADIMVEGFKEELKYGSSIQEKKEKFLKRKQLKRELKREQE